MSLHPISDKAEVSVDFPDKAYLGNFGRHSQFDAYTDADAVAIKLVRLGEDRREVVAHLHYGLLADILGELARSLAARGGSFVLAKKQGNTGDHSHAVSACGRDRR